MDAVRSFSSKHQSDDSLDATIPKETSVLSLNSTISSIVSESQGRRKPQRPGSSPQRRGETRAQRGVEIAASYTAR